MQENQTLRNLLKSLSAFIGDGAGGLLPKLGWEMSDFNSFINRGETDTAWDGYQKRKKVSMDVNASGSQLGQKRASEDDSIAARAKKARPGEPDNGYSMLLPMHNSPIGGSGIYPPARPSGENGLFSDMMKNTNGSGIFSPPNTTYGNGSNGVNSYQTSSYMPSVNMMDSTLPPLAFPSGSPATAPQHRPTSTVASDEIEDDDDPNKNEAYKLIQYASLRSCNSAAYSPTAIIWTTSRETARIACLLPCGRRLCRGEQVSVSNHSPHSLHIIGRFLMVSSTAFLHP